jgi:hypothetical protein
MTAQYVHLCTYDSNTANTVWPIRSKTTGVPWASKAELIAGPYVESWFSAELRRALVKAFCRADRTGGWQQAGDTAGCHCSSCQAHYLNLTLMLSGVFADLTLEP